MDNQDDMQPQDPTPGYLDPLLGGLEPALPPGSWDRLQARKRRRAVAWWWPAGLLLLVGGFAAWMWSANPMEDTKDEIASNPTEKPLAKRSERNTLSQSSSPKAQPDRTSTQTLAQAMERPSQRSQTSEKPKQSAQNQTAKQTPASQNADAQAQSERAPAPSVVQRQPAPAVGLRVEDSRQRGHNMSDVSTPVLPGPQGRRRRNIRDQQAQTAAVGLALGQRTSRQSVIAENKNGQLMSPSTEENLALTLPEAVGVPTTHISTPAQPKSTIMETSPGLAAETNTGVISPAVPAPSMAMVVDTIPDSTIAKAPIKTLKPDSTILDTTPRRDIGLPRIAFKLALTGQFAQPAGKAAAPTLEGVRAGQAATRLRSGYGLGLEFGPVIRLSRRIGLQPTAGIGTLWQRTDLGAVAGDKAAIRMIQQADGTITGEPINLPGPQVATRTLLLLRVGAHLHAVLAKRVSVQGGIHYVRPYVLDRKGTTGQKPKIDMPQLSAGLNYRLASWLELQASAQWLSFSQGALAGVERSRGKVPSGSLGLRLRVR